jgi:hypothetical protein
MQSVMSNNGPLFDFFAFFDLICDSKMTSSEKLAHIVIARKAHSAGGTVAPSRSEVARQASCSEATLKRSYRLLETFFQVNKRIGKTTEYTPKTSVTTDQIALAIEGIRNGGGAHHEPGLAKNIPPHPPKKNNIYNNPPTPQNDPIDPFGLNPHRAAMRGDVWFDGDDRLQVRNGFKSELLRLAGGEDQLRIELDRAAEWIGPKTPPQIMKSKVRGRVQSQISERLDRDKRYENAKASNGAKPVQGPSLQRRATRDPNDMSLEEYRAYCERI